MIELFANSGDPDQSPHIAASDLGLHCLPITLLGVSRLQRVNVNMDDSKMMHSKSSRGGNYIKSTSGNIRGLLQSRRTVNPRHKIEKRGTNSQILTKQTLRMKSQTQKQRPAKEEPPSNDQ